MVDHYDGNVPPNDQRNFVHKRVFGAAGGFLSGGFQGAARGFVSGGGRPSMRTGGAPQARRVDFQSQGQFLTARSSGALCRPGQFRVGGVCVDLRAAAPGGNPLFSSAGTDMVATGVYAPFVQDRMVRLCNPGDVLGKDGFCHKKGSIPNKEREYPRGTRPLGTPGEMAALRKAATFGRRMETTVKRMQKIGVLKKASRPKARPTTAAQHHAGG